MSTARQGSLGGGGSSPRPHSRGGSGSWGGKGIFLLDALLPAEASGGGLPPGPPASASSQAGGDSGRPGGGSSQATPSVGLGGSGEQPGLGPEGAAASQPGCGAGSASPTGPPEPATPRPSGGAPLGGGWALPLRLPPGRWGLESRGPGPPWPEARAPGVTRGLGVSAGRPLAQGLLGAPWGPLSPPLAAFSDLPSGDSACTLPPLSGQVPGGPGLRAPTPCWGGNLRPGAGAEAALQGANRLALPAGSSGLPGGASGLTAGRVPRGELAGWGAQHGPP